MRAAIRWQRAALALALLGAGITRLPAQVSQPTDADKQKVPMQFRPDDQKGAGAPNFAPRGTPKGYQPDADPREFSGSYVGGGGGGPPGGGAGGPPGGAPPGGGAGGPPGGAPSGGGSPPGGAPPGGGSPPGGASPPAGAAAGGGAACIPDFGSGAYATHIISSPTELLVVGEENHRIRRIYIGAQLPAKVTPVYSGHSVGRWDGNTLVVDTVGIKGRDGQHLRERWTRQRDGSISVESTTLDAGGNASGPASTSTLVWRPDISFVENICEDFGEAFGSGYGSGGKP